MRQNRIVLLLPLFVMIGLFLFGFYIINQSSTITNEELVNYLHMEIETKIEEENKPAIEATWTWKDFPTDGLVGSDIIEVIFLDDSMEAIPFLAVNGTLQLEQSGEVIYQLDDFHYTNEGFAFIFPNEVIENQIFGPRGNVSLLIAEPEERAAYIEVKYYHTWEEWESRLENGAEINGQLSEQGVHQNWVTSRSTSLR